MRFDLSNGRDRAQLASLVQELQHNCVSFSVRKDGDWAELIIHSGA